MCLVKQICFLNKKKQCCICQDMKSYVTKCNICTENYVCNDCLLCLCEKGISSKCPVCRQQNWYQKVNKNKVVPHNEENESNVIQTGNIEQLKRYKINRCCNIYFLILNIITLLVITYFFGFLSLLIIFNGDMKMIERYLWLPIIIGPIEVFLTLFCCFRCVCNVKFDSPFEFYQTMSYFRR